MATYTAIPPASCYQLTGGNRCGRTCLFHHVERLHFDFEKTARDLRYRNIKFGMRMSRKGDTQIIDPALYMIREEFFLHCETALRHIVRRNQVTHHLA